MEGIGIIILDILLGALLVAIGIVARYFWKRGAAYMDNIVESMDLMKLDALQTMYESFKNELRDVIEDIVDALDQIYVKDWKDASADGKLTKDEIDTIQSELILRVRGNLSKNAREFLDTAVDNLDDLILEIAEAYLDYKRSDEGKVEEPAEPEAA